MSDIVEGLTKFDQHCIRESFDGCDMDGGTIQELAVKCGLLIETKFDPAIHRDPEHYAEAGEAWFVYDPAFSAKLKELEA